MFKRNISCTVDGDTFVGHYRVSQHDRVVSVAVQFERHALAARLGPTSEEILARSLLGELVRAKLAAEMPTRGLAA